MIGKHTPLLPPGSKWNNDFGGADSFGSELRFLLG
jgi:hypothetical protein